MSPLDSFWNGVLSLLTPIVTPDWGKLVVLIPWLLLLLVLAYLGRMGMVWASLYRSQPVRGPKVRARSIRPLVIAHLGVIAVGVLVLILAFVVGANDPAWKAGNSPLGLVVNVPLLILGAVLAVGSAGNAARLWSHEPGDEDPIDRVVAVARRHPGRTRRVAAFVVGVVLAATGLLLGTAPGPGAQPVPVAVVPLLLLGLALAVGAVGSTIAAVWRSDPDFDASESSSLVTTEH